VKCVKFNTTFPTVYREEIVNFENSFLNKTNYPVDYCASFHEIVFIKHTIETTLLYSCQEKNSLSHDFLIKVFRIYYRPLIFQFVNRTARNERLFEKSTLICDIEFDKQSSVSGCVKRE